MTPSVRWVPLWPVVRPWIVLSYGLTYTLLVAVQEPVEPVDLPVETLHQVPRLAGACQVVILQREHHELRGHTEMFERTVPLLTLLDGHAQIVIGVKNQRRRLHVRRV